jgi:hypothetical protein
VKKKEVMKMLTITAVIAVETRFGNGDYYALAKLSNGTFATGWDIDRMNDFSLPPNAIIHTYAQEAIELYKKVCTDGLPDDRAKEVKNQIIRI